MGAQCCHSHARNCEALLQGERLALSALLEWKAHGM